ncbi:hypothetical protein ACMFMF_007439 [Clarireedia jacksonii]
MALYWKVKYYETFVSRKERLLEINIEGRRERDDFECGSVFSFKRAKTVLLASYHIIAIHYRIYSANQKGMRTEGKLWVVFGIGVQGVPGAFGLDSDMETESGIGLGMEIIWVG